jgi:hypothetical protein
MLSAEDDSVKCLSLWQPWAAALFLSDAKGLRMKPDETRSWPAAYRGPLAIHAAGRPTRPYEDYDPELDRILREVIGRTTADLPRGAILGVVEMVDCRLTRVVRPERSPEQTLWGNYEDADLDGRRRFAFTMAKPVMLPVPIPWRGAQGFFEVPDSIFDTFNGSGRKRWADE